MILLSLEESWFMAVMAVLAMFPTSHFQKQNHASVQAASLGGTQAQGGGLSVPTHAARWTGLRAPDLS